MQGLSRGPSPDKVSKTERGTSAMCELGEIHRARARALKFLISVQSSDGSWRDFNLDVGESTSWATGFVLYALSTAATDRGESVSGSKEKAARFLYSTMRESGGWGYNERVSEDADSTAHVILALRSSGQSVPAQSCERLLAYEVEPGLFQTFNDKPGDHSWSLPVLEVSAAVVLALNDSERARVLESHFRAELRQFRRVSSFWWQQSAYTSYMIVLVAQAFRLDGIRKSSVAPFLESSLSMKDPFGVSLSGMVALRTESSFVLDGCASFLTKTQKTNGSWKGSALLRYTTSSCTDIWLSKRIPAGRVYADVGNRFTTALALRFLSEYARFRKGESYGYPASNE